MNSKWKNILRRIKKVPIGLYQQLFYMIVDRPLPLQSSDEQELRNELIKTFRDFNIKPVKGAQVSQAQWNENMNRLQEHILQDDVRGFLRWEVIRNTMFVDRDNYIKHEYAFLKRLPTWKFRWKKALTEDLAGHPIPSLHNPHSSDNLIHHAYHIARLEEATKLNVSEFNTIFEFGGGYGSMCRLFFHLGFSGKYIIFDLPAFSTLQKYYLKTIKLPVCKSAEEFPLSEKGIICISDLAELQKILPVEAVNNLFVATWSISETPKSLREKVLPLVSKFKTFLLGYQSSFGEMDNISYFDTWANELQLIEWNNFSIEHLPGNYYLIGNRLRMNGK